MSHESLAHGLASLGAPGSGSTNNADVHVQQRIRRGYQHGSAARISELTLTAYKLLSKKVTQLLRAIRYTPSLDTNVKAVRDFGALWESKPVGGSSTDMNEREETDVRMNGVLVARHDATYSDTGYNDSARARSNPKHRHRRMLISRLKATTWIRCQ